MIEASVSLAAAGACASTAAVLFAADRLPGIKRATNRLHTDRIQAVLVLTAVTGLGSTGIGGWWQEKVTALNDWASNAIGSYTGLAVMGVAGLLCLLYLINDLITRKVEARTLVLAALLPVLAFTIPGTIGAGVVAVVEAVSGTVASLIGSLFGIGG